MATTCSIGHISEWDDYCSVCGVQLSSENGSSSSEEFAAQQSAASEAKAIVSEGAESALECPNCGENYVEGDIFCENCGLDLLSGTLPEEVEPQVAASEHGSSTATISVDLEFFERMQFAGVEPPGELPEPVVIELPPTDILVGRQSDSRGTFPEIDLRAVFGSDSPAADPAVSSTHCRLHRGAKGWTVTDLDSTNGTYVGGETDALPPGRPMNLMPGTPIFVGAWTRIELRDPAEAPESEPPA